MYLLTISVSSRGTCSGCGAKSENVHTIFNLYFVVERRGTYMVYQKNTTTTWWGNGFHNIRPFVLEKLGCNVIQTRDSKMLSWLRKMCTMYDGLVTAKVLELAGNDVAGRNEVEVLYSLRLLQALNVLEQSVFARDFVRPARDPHSSYSRVHVWWIRFSEISDKWKEMFQSRFSSHWNQCKHGTHMRYSRKWK